MAGASQATLSVRVSRVEHDVELHAYTVLRTGVRHGTRPDVRRRPGPAERSRAGRRRRALPIAPVAFELVQRREQADGFERSVALPDARLLHDAGAGELVERETGGLLRAAD